MEKSEMATSSSSSGSLSREGTAKARVSDQISQAVQSTSNLLHLMQGSSPSQAHLIKLPKNLLAKASIIKNTGKVLEQLPRVVSSLDAYVENGLQSALHLKTVVQLLSNMESTQLRSAFPARHSEEEAKDPSLEKVVETTKNSIPADYLTGRSGRVEFASCSSPVSGQADLVSSSRKIMSIGPVA